MTIRLSGIGSGIDVEALIEGLVNASSQQRNTLTDRASRFDAAITSVSEVGSLLATLEGATRELDTIGEVSSYVATSDNDAIVTTASSNAAPGVYQVVVDHLASAERTYSGVLANSLNTPLDLNGQLTLQVGFGDLVDPEGTLLVGADTLLVEIEPSDTIESIVNKINAGDLRVRAATFFDGTGYRISVSGLDVGLEKDVIFDDGGLGLGFNDPGATVQAAQDALIHVDGLAVTSKTNQVSGAIQGVTLALAKDTDDPITITVATDAKALTSKVQKVVDAYNSIVNKVHVLTGFGTTLAPNSALAADSTLRGVLSRLSGALSSTFGSGEFNTFRSIGVTRNNNGTLTLDSSKLGDAIAKDFRAVQDLLAGDDIDSEAGTKGLADLLRELTDDLGGAGGLIDTKKEGLRTRTRSLQDSADREQQRLDNMAAQLRRTFTILDSTVAANQAQLQFLLSS